MHTLYYAPCSTHSFIAISGAERVDFLQNIITQNMSDLHAGDLRAGALLSPQGKLLCEFLLWIQSDAILLECDQNVADKISKHLHMYKLRAKVSIDPISTTSYLIWGAPDSNDEHILPDPRSTHLGFRSLSKPTNVPQEDINSWHKLRIKAGIAQGADELPWGACFPLEFGLQHMHMIDFHKGCYIGQEVTSRSHRRGTLRKGLWPVEFTQTAPAPGTPIMNDDKNCGTIIAAYENIALAHMRFDSLNTPLNCAHMPLTILPGLFDMQKD